MASGSAHSSLPGFPFLVLEHVNFEVLGDWTDRHELFWFSILAASRDARHPGVLANDVRWANFGYQQFHLPCYEPEGGASQPMGEDLEACFKNKCGFAELAWTSEDYQNGLKKRFDHAGWPYSETVDDNSHRLQTEDPSGNQIVIRCDVQRSAGEENWVSPCARGELLWGSGEPVLPCVSKGQSFGLGLSGVTLNVPVGASGKIGRFYEKVFGSKNWRAEEGKCLVPIGGVCPQWLVFEEDTTSTRTQRSGDGPVKDPEKRFAPHIAVYIATMDEFEAIYRRAEEMGVLYQNPQFPATHYKSFEESSKICEFRIKNIVDVGDAEKTVVFELEHEIRSLHHRAMQHMQPFIKSSM